VIPSELCHKEIPVKASSEILLHRLNFIRPLFERHDEMPPSIRISNLTNNRATLHFRASLHPLCNKELNLRKLVILFVFMYLFI
jgi:hypothetical protein